MTEEVHVCTGGPFPNFSTMFESNKDLFEFPNIKVELPELPSLPKPLFPDENKFSFEMCTGLSELQTQQMMTSFKAFIQPMVDFLDMPIEDILPSMPDLPDFTLIELMSNQVDELMEAIAKYKRDHAGENSPAWKLPDPLFPNFSSNSEESLAAMQQIVREHFNDLIKTTKDLLKSVTDKLDIGLPEIPELPDTSEILDKIYENMEKLIPNFDIIKEKFELIEEATGKAIADVKDFFGAFPNIRAEIAYLRTHAEELAKRLGTTTDTDYFKQIKEELDELSDMLNDMEMPSISEIFDFEIPGFPKITIPDPLISHTSSKESDFQASFKNFFADLQIHPMKEVKKFIDDTLGKLISFEFPEICMDCLFPDLPEGFFGRDGDGDGNGDGEEDETPSSN